MMTPTARGKTVEEACRLIEGDEVLLIFYSLGTPTNSSMQRYMNAKNVRQLFVASGAVKWNDPKKFPRTMGWAPSYQAEGFIYAQYLLRNHPEGKIATLCQNDDFGKDYLKGLTDGLAGKIPVVARVPMKRRTRVPISQVASLQASGADIFFDVTTPALSRFPALRPSASIGPARSAPAPSFQEGHRSFREVTDFGRAPLESERLPERGVCGV